MDKFENINFDRAYRNRISDAEVVPPAFVWENVERRLQRRRRITGYWASGVLALAVVAVSFFYFSKNENGADGFSKNGPTENGAAGFSFSENLEKKTSPLVLENDLADENPENLTDENGTPERKIFRQKSVGRQKFMAQKLDFSNSKKSTEAAELESVTENLQPQTPGVLENEKVNLNEILRFENMAAAKKTAATDLLKTDLRNLENEGPTLPPIRPFKIKNKISCYGFKRQYSAVLWDVYVAPVFADQKLAAQNTDFTSYKNRRAGAEKYSVGGAIGARASVIRGGLVARGGLEYAQFTEVFDRVISNYTNTIINIRTVTTGNETKTYYDTTYQYGEKHEKIYNRFGMLNLPVSAGTELRFRKMGFSLNVGLSANLLFWKKGQILEPKPGTIDVSSDKTDLKKFFKKSAGLSTFGSVQGFWKLKNGTRVFVEPYFQRVLKPVSLPTAPVEQRYDFYGLKIGLTKVID